MSPARYLVRIGAASLMLLLAACGAGSGDGMDQNGQPLPSVGGGGGDAPPIPDLMPTLDSIQAKVFTPTCAVSGCHSGADAPQGLQLEQGLSARNLINVPSPRDSHLLRVIPGNPDGSFIIQKLEGTQTLGQRMPRGGPFLPQSTIDVIRQWITSGAPRE